MRNMNQLSRTLSFLIAGFILMSACTKGEVAGLEQPGILDEIITVEEIMMADINLEEVDGMPENPEFTINGQDYAITIGIDSTAIGMYGIQYGISINVFNLGNQGFDDIQIELLHNRRIIFDYHLTAFPNIGYLFYSTHLFQGPGKYTVRIVLPGRHHDWNLANNSDASFVYW